nr:MAG TPA: NikA, BACTERIAL CONJUGATION, RELAXASE, DNA [Bacteriophage sp.]
MDEKKMIENYKSRVKRQNEKAKENYDRISVMLPKGTKDRIQAQGLTINGFVNQLVLEKLDELENNKNECPF